MRREGELRSALQRLDGSDPAAMQQMFGELVGPRAAPPGAARAGVGNG